jgi:ADP-heptose:LPS heptosyltransferase
MLTHRPYKHILCIRPDNMGDVLMSGPAIRALKNHFGARITLLTSRAGSGIASFMREIDNVIIADLPWIKTENPCLPENYQQLIARLRSLNCDLAVIFTVYSQNPLPTALLCWQAGIGATLAYCRENPYGLLTHWVPDEEPYSQIHHQVKRDLDLAKHLGAVIDDDRLHVTVNQAARTPYLSNAGIAPDAPYIVLHPGVSETKREYPLSLWIETAALLHRAIGLPIIITGAGKDETTAETICAGTTCAGAANGPINLAGKLGMEAFISILAGASLIITVNTVTAHLAAAVGTPEIVLYALTNPQHTPWKNKSVVLPFSVNETLQSRNQVIRYVSAQWKTKLPPPTPETILQAARDLLKSHPGSPEDPLPTHPAPKAAAAPAAGAAHASE